MTHPLPACPHLPAAGFLFSANHAKPWRDELGERYYIACLESAQSKWQQGLPAQAILQVNKSFMAELNSFHLPGHPDYQNLCPYSAIVWICQNAPDGQFLGNPVRHFQHLASRMSPKSPNAPLRTWRAWACFHLSMATLPEYPRDEEQIIMEQLVIPTFEDTLAALQDTGIRGESELVAQVYASTS